MIKEKYKSYIEFFIANKKGFNQRNIDYSTYKNEVKKIKRSSLFFSEYYDNKYKEVKKSGLSPLTHYILCGEAKNLKPNPLFYPRWYLGKHNVEKGTLCLLHYNDNWATNKDNPTPLFYEKWYLEQNQDVKKSGMSPLLHYMLFGENESRQPNPYFQPSFYKKSYPAVIRAGYMLLEHYYEHAKFSHQPNPIFNNAWYKKCNMREKDSTHPLNHYHHSTINKTADTTPNFNLKEFELHYGELLYAYNDCGNNKQKTIESLLNIKKKPHWLERIFKKGFKSPSDLSSLVIDAHPIFYKNLNPYTRKEITNKAIKSNIKFSIIMPTFNRADIIDIAIESILKQTYQNFEIIIIDDCSIDNTIEYLETKYSYLIANKTLKIYKTEKNSGASAARNIGLAKASGNVISYLDSDNSWYPETLELYACGLYNENVSSVYTPIDVVDAECLENRIVGQIYSRQALLRQNFIDMNGFAHRAQGNRGKEFFCEDLTRLVDWEFIIRITKDSSPLYLPVITTKYRLNHNSFQSITRTHSILDNYNKIQALHFIEMARENIIGTEQIFKILQSNYPLVKYKNENKNSKVCILLEHENDFHKDTFLKYSICHEVYFISGDEYINAFNKKSIRSLKDIDCEYFYIPTSLSAMMSKDALLNCVLAMYFDNLDVAVCSNGYSSLPNIYIRRLRDSLLLKKCHVVDFINNYRFNGSIRGKVLFLNYDPTKTTSTVNLEKVFDQRFSYDNKSSFFWTKGTSARTVYENQERMPSIINEIKKPRILCLAMKVAVGGVERLTLDVIRELKDSFSFAYIALEPISAENGSMHFEISNNVEFLIEGNEIVSREQHVSLLSYINTQYKPDLVWVTNGSVWLHQNISTFKDIFKNTPIVDQQCYDHKAGWINKISTKSNTGFDHYVAVNEHINQVFINNLKMKKSNVSLIKHGVCFKNATQLLNMNPDNKETIKQELGIPSGKKIWIFVGRLTTQKNPLLFLELAKLNIDSASEEHFVLIGNGELVNECQAFIKQHKLTNVTMINRIDPISKAFFIADGMVITSHYEGLPLALIEAIYVGVPIFSSDVGEIKSVVEKYDAGLIYDITDIHKLNSSFMEFKGNEKEYKINIRSKRDDFYDEYSMKSVSKKYSNLWCRLIKEKQ